MHCASLRELLVCALHASCCCSLSIGWVCSQPAPCVVVAANFVRINPVSSSAVSIVGLSRRRWRSSGPASPNPYSSFPRLLARSLSFSPSNSLVLPSFHPLPSPSPPSSPAPAHPQSYARADSQERVASVGGAGENRLDEVPATLGRLTNLRSLRLETNWLRTIPVEICCSPARISRGFSPFHLGRA
eukprot:2488213-Rhodomonas_salina.1